MQMLARSYVKKRNWFAVQHCINLYYFFINIDVGQQSEQDGSYFFSSVKSTTLHRFVKLFFSIISECVFYLAFLCVSANVCLVSCQTRQNSENLEALLEMNFALSSMKNLELYLNKH